MPWLGCPWFAIDGYIHYLEPFWMFVVVMYIFFIRGKKWGIIFLIADILATSIYYLFFLNDNIAVLMKLEYSRLLNMCFEFCVCLLIIGYIVQKFIQTTEYAEAELKKVNEVLNNEKKVVEIQNREKNSFTARNSPPCKK